MESLQNKLSMEKKIENIQVKQEGLGRPDKIKLPSFGETNSEKESKKNFKTFIFIGLAILAVILYLIFKK